MQLLVNLCYCHCVGNYGMLGGIPSLVTACWEAFLPSFLLTLPSLQSEQLYSLVEIVMLCGKLCFFSRK